MTFGLEYANPNTNQEVREGADVALKSSTPRGQPQPCPSSGVGPGGLRPQLAPGDQSWARLHLRHPGSHPLKQPPQPHPAGLQKPLSTWDSPGVHTCSPLLLPQPPGSRLEALLPLFLGEGRGFPGSQQGPVSRCLQGEEANGPGAGPVVPPGKAKAGAAWNPGSPLLLPLLPSRICQSATGPGDHLWVKAQSPVETPLTCLPGAGTLGAGLGACEAGPLGATPDPHQEQERSGRPPSCTPPPGHWPSPLPPTVSHPGWLPSSLAVCLWGSQEDGKGHPPPGSGLFPNRETGSVCFSNLPAN